MLLFSGGVQANADKWRTVPVSMPITFTSNNAPEVIRVHVKKTNRYAVALQFFEGPIQHQQLYTLLGGDHKDADGLWVEPGVPAKFIVRIYKRDEALPLFGQISDHGTTTAGYHSRWCSLVSVRLEPGDYLIKLETQQIDEALRHVRTKMVVGPAHHGK